MHTHRIRRIAFAGLGLIGASLLQTIRRAAISQSRQLELIGWDPGFGPEDVDIVTRQLGLDRFEMDPALLFDADVIILCAPVLANLDLLDQVRRHAPETAFVTDVSSTKSLMAEKASALGLDYIGMHPIAGREQQGYQAASPDLLTGKLLVVCSGTSLPESGTAAEFFGLLAAAGCTPVPMTPEEHDRVYANISHLPQMVATALMGHCAENIARSGPGFASVTRLAGSPWPVWRDIITTNSRNIADELDGFAASLAGLAGAVREQNLDEIAARFAEANRLYRTLQQGDRQ